MDWVVADGCAAAVAAVLIMVWEIQKASSRGRLFVREINWVTSFETSAGVVDLRTILAIFSASSGVIVIGAAGAGTDTAVC